MNKTHPPDTPLTILGPLGEGYREILTDEAQAFLVELQRRFNARRLELLAARVERQQRLDAGERPDFLPETADVRAAEWTVAPVPAELLDRRVEITGPVDRKMIINALNSGVRVFMADVEDSNSPTWDNVIQGQINLRDAVAGTIAFHDTARDKRYTLADNPAVLMVRPRGWHLPEKHILIDGEVASASLVDFGLFFFHNARTQLERGTGPYFYLPKLESYLEARLWNDVFLFAQERLGIARGTIKATVLIETILAAFEMDEILYELRDHSAGLNCGRWDYIFSFIKKFRADPGFVLPDRDQVTMGVHFLKSYVDLLIRTCHRRGAHAMGGMAAQIPIKNDPEANARAIAKVRADKEREAHAGHDGTWIAHPGLAATALEAFDAVMPDENQLDVLREEVSIEAADLLAVPEGTITEEGLRHNIRVGVQYLEAWLGGNGCVPLYHLMEDAATAEISRAQIWQWVHHEAALDEGRVITPELFEDLFDEEMAKLMVARGDTDGADKTLDLAARLFGGMIRKSELDDFLTLPAYEELDCAATDAPVDAGS